MLKSTTFKIDETLWRELKQFALSKEMSMAAIIIMSIKDFIDPARKQDKKKAKKKA